MKSASASSSFEPLKEGARHFTAPVTSALDFGPERQLAKYLFTLKILLGRS
jgi:hypothetical protein